MEFETAREKEKEKGTGNGTVDGAEVGDQEEGDIKIKAVDK